MLDILIDAIPWDDVIDGALKGLAAIGIGVAAAGTAEAISRLATGKGVFEHVRNFSAGIEDRLKKWMQRQRVNDVIINKLVFVFESINSFATTAQKGMDSVRVSIFGKTSSGKRVNTGEQVVMSVTKKEANELTNKHEIEAGLAELGF